MNKYIFIFLTAFLSTLNISNSFIQISKKINGATILKNRYMCSTTLHLTNSSNTESYLEKINKKNEDSIIRRDTLRNIKPSDDMKIKRLEKIQNNISNYMRNKNFTLDKGYQSTYRPIPKATFDTIFLNIFQINKIYISSNKDRMIFELINNNRYVYYIKNSQDYQKMQNFLDVIPNKTKIIIINDIEKTMNDPYGYLYCEPK